MSERPTVENDARLPTERDQWNALVGIVAAREFEAAADAYKPGLREWATALPALDDLTFRREAESAIHDSALVASFRGNWEHEHFRASACYHESERRKHEAHGEDCAVTTIYERAFNQVARDQGHHSMARDSRPCTCSSDERVIPPGSGDTP